MHGPIIDMRWFELRERVQMAAIWLGDICVRIGICLF